MIAVDEKCDENFLFLCVLVGEDCKDIPSIMNLFFFAHVHVCVEYNF